MTVPTIGLGPKAYDFAPNGLGIGNLGALNGGVTPTPGGWGTLGAAWDINGTTGYSQSLLVSTATDNFSFFCLFSPDVATQNGMIFFNGKGGSNGWGFYHNNGSGGGGTVLTVIADGKAFNAVSSSYSLSAGSLVFAHFSRVAGANTLFINGLTYSTGTQSFNTPTSGGTFIGSRAASSILWNGKVWIAGIGGPCSAVQAANLHSCLRTGEPFPLFEQTVSDRFMASASAPVVGNWPWFISDGFGYLIGA